VRHSSLGDQIQRDILSPCTRFNETPAAQDPARLTETGPAAPFRANFSETRTRFDETGHPYQILAVGERCGHLYLT
jgi:hypothetical protein